MPPKIKNRAAIAVVPLIVSLSGLGLTACGGSSGDASTHSHTGSAAATTTAGATATSTPSSNTTAESTPLNAAAKRRLAIATRVASCMRRNGVNVAEPSPEGYISINGGIANTPRFKVAAAKCGSLLAEAQTQAHR
jgi:hypothetical protein